MKSVVQIQRQGKVKAERCQPTLEMSASSQSRNVRVYVPAAAACVVRSGNSRLRHG